MLVADADVPRPVVDALKILRYPIATYEDIGAPARPDTALMDHCIRTGNYVLVTRDTGIPSQAYVARYPERGLTVALLRWKSSTFEDFQKMAELILRDGAKWEATAAREPSVISVGARGSRYRPWGKISPHTLQEGHTRT